MNKSIIILSLSALAFLGATQTHAEEIQATIEGGAPVKVEIRANTSATKPEVRAIRAEVKSIATSTKAEIKNAREDFKADKKAAASSTKADIEMKRATLKAEIESRKADLKENRTELRDAASARVSSTIKNAIARLNEALERLTKIKDSIEARLVKFESAGANASDARANLVIVSEKIELANDAVSAVADFHTSSTATTTIDIPGFKTVAKNAQTAIQEAHKSLIDTVSLMKSLQASIKPGKGTSASGTPATTTTGDVQ